MADLYGMAGAGGAGAGYGALQGIGGALSTGGGAAMFVNPLAGAGMLGLGALANLISNPFRAAAEKREGQKRFEAASAAYKKRIEAHPNLYSTAGVTKGFNKARSSIEQTNSAQTSALMDRYSSIQRKQMSNRIKSGLSSGAAQASSIQNNIAFQRTANDLFTKQGQTMSQLALREQQAKMNMAGQVEARKQMASRDALLTAGVTNPAALGGLATKISGGY